MLIAHRYGLGIMTLEARMGVEELANALRRTSRLSVRRASRRKAIDDTTTFGSAARPRSRASQSSCGVSHSKGCFRRRQHATRLSPAYASPAYATSRANRRCAATPSRKGFRSGTPMIPRVGCRGERRHDQRPSYGRTASVGRMTRTPTC